MSELPRGIVVAHGDLAAGLVSAVKCITGVDDALVPISNEGLGADELRSELARVCSSCPVVVFVDLLGGSCAMAGLGVQHLVDEVPVLTGVNLPMLIDFVFQRELPLDELIGRLEAKGARESEPMSLDLLRVDERLIHGQVVVGWGTRLGLRYYLVVDDALADSTWEQDLYRSALPDGVTADFLSTRDAIARFADIDADPSPGALITRGTSTMRALAESGALEGRRVNLGGLHGGPGRDQVLDYLCLGPEEREDLAVIAAHVRRVSARDLPTAPEVTLDHLGT